MYTASLSAYLAPGPWVDADHPGVVAEAARLAALAANPRELVRRCFEFVRDEVAHSWDQHQALAAQGAAAQTLAAIPVTCRASEVLARRTGYCYAKSHLLAALLRANGIPCGLCYQRLTIADGGGPPYCLHGLNAVYLPDLGWLRVDARGNKPGVNARFDPPGEYLAFSLRDPGERDLPEIWAEPLPGIVETLGTWGTVQQVMENLPDLALIDPASPLRGAR